jgi:hypothetical protein
MKIDCDQYKILMSISVAYQLTGTGNIAAAKNFILKNLAEPSEYWLTSEFKVRPSSWFHYVNETSRKASYYM